MGIKLFALAPPGAPPSTDHRPKKIKEAEASDGSEQLYAKAELKQEEIESERRALGRIDITGGDEVSLGFKSSGWAEFQEVLRAKLLFLKKQILHVPTRQLPR